MAATGGKGVIVELDFAAFNGAELLYGLTRDFLAKLDGLAFDKAIEARYFTGKDYLSALTAYFAVAKTKKTALKASKDLPAAFAKALNAELPAIVTPGFKNFLKTLTDKDVKVILSTRANLELLAPAFEQVVSDNVIMHHEESQIYGALKWDDWRRTCSTCRLCRIATKVVAGSGLSVNSALLAGFGSMAVIHDHVAYQDFGGASEIVKDLGAPAARKLLEIMHVE